MVLNNRVLTTVMVRYCDQPASRVVIRLVKDKTGQSSLGGSFPQWMEEEEEEEASVRAPCARPLPPIYSLQSRPTSSLAPLASGLVAGGGGGDHGGAARSTVLGDNCRRRLPMPNLLPACTPVYKRQWAKSTNVPHASNLIQMPVREHARNVTKFSRNRIQT